MDRFTRMDLQALLDPRESFCVSVFTATHRGAAEPQDLVRWKEQLNAAEQKLVARGLRRPDAAVLIDQARVLLTNEEFWRDMGDGLALFLADHFIRVFKLPLAFRNQVVAGPRFFVKPLLPWVSGDGRFFVLAVSQNQVRLLEGTAHTVRHLEPPNLPTSKAAALRMHDRDEYLTFHTHPAPVGRAFSAVFSGHGVGIDDHKDELLQYFQKIDHALRNTLGTGHAPLVLATVDYLVPIYRKANKYPGLLDQNIKGNPDHLSHQDLHDRAWPIVAPIFRARTDKAVRQYQQLAGTGRTVHSLSELLPAVKHGEIESLFVVGSQDVWGRFDTITDEVDEHKLEEPGDEELTNLAVSYALSHGRDVHVVEPQDAFAGVPVAGVFFVPMAKHAK